MGGPGTPIAEGAMGGPDTPTNLGGVGGAGGAGGSGDAPIAWDKKLFHTTECEVCGINWCEGDHVRRWALPAEYTWLGLRVGLTLTLTLTLT